MDEEFLKTGLQLMGEDVMSIKVKGDKKDGNRIF